ncbi:MAG: BTAD domain-containing putative transcriptional regulator, partial [Ilumatobacteraceae bacterium]
MELISDDGAQLEIGPLKRRVVLAVLALSGERLTSADRLIESVWGASPPATALHTLHGLVSQLRVTLGQEAIESHAAGYRLNAANVTVDVDQFQEKLAAGDDSDAAMAMWTGAALEGLGDSDAIVVERQRLEALRLVAVEAWCDRRLAVGAESAVIDLIESELPASPFRETLWERLMLAQYRAHRQADALAT